MSTRKPNFLIIGAPRCGTTYLAKNLASHPDVFLTTGDNEDLAGDVHFFDANTELGRQNLAKGTEWYFNLFSGAGNAIAIGEKTADYIVDPDASSLIADTLDDPRIIVMIRDPLERAWSHFCHSRHRLPSHLKFQDLVKQGTDVRGIPILTAGLYARHLQPYINRFGSHNILILVKEDIDHAPGEELARACSFLGINAEYTFLHFETYVNAGSSSTLATATARAGRALKSRFPRVYHSVIRGPFAKPVALVIRLLRGKTNDRMKRHDAPRKAPFDPALRRQLRDYYRSDVDAMSDFMKRNLNKVWWDDI